MPDEDYVDGKIDLRIGESRILSATQWDLVDQPWAYLIDGVAGVLFEGKDLESCFPDQPLRLSLQSVSTTQLKVTIGEDSHLVQRACFAEAVAIGCNESFHAMLRLAPNAHVTWRAYLAKVDKLLVAFIRSNE